MEYISTITLRGLLVVILLTTYVQAAIYSLDLSGCSSTCSFETLLSNALASSILESSDTITFMNSGSTGSLSVKLTSTSSFTFDTLNINNISDCYIKFDTGKGFLNVQTLNVDSKNTLVVTSAVTSVNKAASVDGILSIVGGTFIGSVSLSKSSSIVSTSGNASFTSDLVVPLGAVVTLSSSTTVYGNITVQGSMTVKSTISSKNGLYVSVGGTLTGGDNSVISITGSSFISGTMTTSAVFYSSDLLTIATSGKLTFSSKYQTTCTVTAMNGVTALGTISIPASYYYTYFIVNGAVANFQTQLKANNVYITFNAGVVMSGLGFLYFDSDVKFRTTFFVGSLYIYDPSSTFTATDFVRFVGTSTLGYSSVSKLSAGMQIDGGATLNLPSASGMLEVTGGNTTVYGTLSNSGGRVNLKSGFILAPGGSVTSGSNGFLIVDVIASINSQMRVSDASITGPFYLNAGGSFVAQDHSSVTFSDNVTQAVGTDITLGYDTVMSIAGHAVFAGNVYGTANSITFTLTGGLSIPKSGYVVFNYASATVSVAGYPNNIAGGLFVAGSFVTSSTPSISGSFNLTYSSASAVFSSGLNITRTGVLGSLSGSTIKISGAASTINGVLRSLGSFTAFASVTVSGQFQALGNTVFSSVFILLPRATLSASNSISFGGDTQINGLFTASAASSFGAPLSVSGTFTATAAVASTSSVVINGTVTLSALSSNSIDTAVVFGTLNLNSKTSFGSLLEVYGTFSNKGSVDVEGSFILHPTAFVTFILSSSSSSDGISVDGDYVVIDGRLYIVYTGNAASSASYILISSSANATSGSFQNYSSNFDSIRTTYITYQPEKVYLLYSNPTSTPTSAPTRPPTAVPSPSPTAVPSPSPTVVPSPSPTPSRTPTRSPTTPLPTSRSTTGSTSPTNPPPAPTTINSTTTANPTDAPTTPSATISSSTTSPNPVVSSASSLLCSCLVLFVLVATL